MKKHIISALLTLVLLLSAVTVGTVGASAAADTATIRIGGKSYSVKVGDFFEYRISFQYTGKNLATAQVELPVDFDGLSSYTQDEITTHIARIAPTTTDHAVVVRSQGDSTIGVNGYVMNFVSPNGYSFTTERRVMSLIFDVKKAGSYTLAAKVRYVDDVDDHAVVDEQYQTLDDRFSFTETVYAATLDTPKLSAATYAGGVRISWDPVPRAGLYRVYYKGANGWTRIADTKATSYLDTEVTSGNSYTYTVRCLAEDGSRFTSDFDHTGKTVTYYTAPVLRLSNLEDGVSIKWDAVPQASKYRVYYRGANGWTKLADTSGTSVVDNDVKSGTNYTYTIRAMDANNNHLSWYYPDGFRIRFISAPQFTLSNDANGVKISWNKVTGAEKYRVFYYGSKGWTRLADTAETSFVDTDVSSNQNYTYTVRCINADGSAYTSDYRAGKKIRYYAAPVLRLSSATDAVSLSWDAVAGASQYRVYIKTDNGWTKLTDTSSTSATDKNVASGNSYTYTIRAMDGNGNHLSWYYPEGFTIRFLNAPTFSLSNAADGVKISWNKVDDNIKYRVFYYGSKGWTRLADTAETSFVDTDVSSNHNYTYTVRCISADGASYVSGHRAGKTIKYYAAPKLTLTNTSSGVSMKWDATAGASQYRLYYLSNSGWVKLTDTAATSFLDKAVDNGATYTYTIRAMDGNGNHLSWYYPDGFAITVKK